jgi:hypothetical protein
MSMESHGDDDGGWGELLTLPPELSGSPNSRDIWASRRNGRRIENFAYSVPEIPQGIFNIS